MPRADAPMPSIIVPGTISGRERYQLLTSLVAPRPIAWISTRSADGAPNLAPFSYFAAVSASPMLVAVSIGNKADGPKDTLRNIRETAAFCINIVTDRHLRQMNATSAPVPAAENEFSLADLTMAEAAEVSVPYVADAPAVLECRLFKEVDLGHAPNTLILGEIVMLRLAGSMTYQPGSRLVDPRMLRPVGRLGGDAYAPLGEVVMLPRPGAPAR